MKRHIFTVAAALSCLLALAAAASWVRSYWVYDVVSCGAASSAYQCTRKAYDSSARFSRWPPGIPLGASSAVLTSFGKLLFQQAVHSDDPLLGAELDSHGWSSDDNAIPSFSYFYAVTRDMTGRGRWTVRQATLRHWALVLLFALLPCAWLLAAVRRGRQPDPAPGAQ